MVKVARLAFIGLFLIPLGVHAMVFSDPIAQVQRALAATEQKLQTLRMVQILKETVNNFQSVKMTYDLAKAGYERATNPKEWKALSEYGKMRLNALATETGDPSQSALFRSIIAVDQAADAYIAKSDLYMGAERIANNSWGSVTKFDNSVGQYLEIGTGQTFIAQTTDAAKTKELEWQMAREQILLAETSAQQIKKETDKFKDKAEKLAEETIMLSRIERIATEDLNQAQYDLKNAKDEKGVRAAQARESRNRNIIEHVRRNKKSNTEIMEGLSKEAEELTGRLKRKIENLEIASSSLGLEGLATRIVLSAGLSSMGEKDIFVKRMGIATWYFLITSLALAFIWHGYKAVTRNEGSWLPHDAVIGLVVAAVLLTPGQPFFIERIAKDIAIISDTLEATVFKDQLTKTKEGLFEPYKEMWKEITGFSGGNDYSSDPRVLVAQKQQMASMNSSGRGVTKMALDVIMGGTASLSMALFQSIAQVASYVGLVSVIISMNLRTLSYWVLMIIAPLFIALAPLRWARKTVLPGWGTAVYAVIMWGFISKTLLMLNNSIASDNMAILTQIARGGDWPTLLMGAIQGGLLAVLMIIAPILSYSLAKGSFDGMTMAAGSALGVVGAGAMRGAYAAGIGGSVISSGAMNSIGNSLNRYAGQSNNPIAKGTRGLAQACLYSARQIGKVGDILGGSQKGSSTEGASMKGTNMKRSQLRERGL